VRGLYDVYALMTNAGISVTQAARIENILIIGSTWISQQIQETRDLPMRVPRLQTNTIGSQTSAR
jgi:hypothetical protein